MVVFVKRIFLTLSLLLAFALVAWADDVNLEDPNLDGATGGAMVGATFSSPNGTLANQQGVPQRCSQNCDEGKSVQVSLGANTNPVTESTLEKTKEETGVQ